MVWKLTTAVKKNVTQIEEWSKDDMKFTLTRGWRWGAAYYDQLNQLIDLDQDEDEYIDVHDIGDVTDLELDDGCWSEFEFSANVSMEDRAHIESLYGEGEMYYELEQEGWYCEDVSTRLYGPLELEEIKDD